MAMGEVESELSEDEVGTIAGLLVGDSDDLPKSLGYRLDTKFQGKNVPNLNY